MVIDHQVPGPLLEVLGVHVTQLRKVLDRVVVAEPQFEGVVASEGEAEAIL